MATARKATKQTPYYHVTPPENVPAILEQGLKSDPESGDSLIFVVTHEVVVPAIARDQVFCPVYGLFEIDPAGVTGEVGPDDVGEFVAPYHRIIRQEVIRPEFLTFRGVFAVPKDAPLETDYWKGERLFGMSRFRYWKFSEAQREFLTKVDTGEMTLDEASDRIQSVYREGVAVA